MLASPVSVEAEESVRLQALRDLNILDSPPEPVFEEAVRLAAHVCGAPIAAINLLDQHRQWFKAKVGLDVSELPREQALCNHVLGRQMPLIIPDALLDRRFSSNIYVVGDPHVRFYAGAPLNTAEGLTLGSLCVIDSVPHELSASQQEALQAIGRQIATQIELRSKLQLLQQVIGDKEVVEKKLRERTLLFEAFMEHSPNIAFIKDGEGRFVYYNRMFCERFAISSSEWLGKNVFDLFPEEFASAYHSLDMVVLTSGVAETVEETSPGPEDSIMFWRTYKFLIPGANGNSLMGGISLDIRSELEAVARLRNSHAQLEKRNKELVALSSTDDLTGLWNRRAFDQRVEADLREGRRFALVLLDIDHFKKHNDTYGHQAGDEALKMVATLLSSACRDSDCVARYGGEEFAVLLSGAGRSEAGDMAERLRRTIELYPWKLLGVTVSAGVTSTCAQMNGISALLRAADDALYRAKQLGRNRVEIAA